MAMSGWKYFRGKQLINDVREATMQALDDTAEEIGAEADQQVPHDEGFLQDSKHIARHPTDLLVQIGYGGGGQSGRPEVPYAVTHHEVPKNFQKGRKHNYLRDPVKEVGPQAKRRNMVKQLKKVL